MNRYSSKILMILYLIYFSGCGTNKIKTNYEIQGNWSVLFDSVYNEICFRKDTLERFNLDWDFLPPSVYKVDNDSLTIKSTSENSRITKYKITFIDSNNAVLENLDTKLNLKKIPDNQFTIDDLINQGFFNYGYESPIPDSLRVNFIDSTYRIREIKFLIENNILNKDTLLDFWKNTNQEYYKYLLEKIK